MRRFIGPKRIAVFLGLVVFLVLAWDKHQAGMLTPAAIQDYRDRHPALAVGLFILIYAASVIAALPTLPLNLAAGFFWGGFLGGAYTALAVTLGGWISFMAARWLVGQPLADRFDSRWVALVQDEFGRHGWKFVAFARINPVIPTGPLNYLFGLTSLSGRDFLWATFVFLLPPSIAIAFIGDMLQTFTVRNTGAAEIVRSVLLASAAVTVLGVLKFVSGIYRRRAQKQ